MQGTFVDEAPGWLLYKTWNWSIRPTINLVIAGTSTSY